MPPRKPCYMCGHIPDSRDATLTGMHIDCAKEASNIAMDLLHGGDNLLFREWYRKRYPGRPVPVRSDAPDTGQNQE